MRFSRERRRDRRSVDVDADAGRSQSVRKGEARSGAADRRPHTARNCARGEPAPLDLVVDTANTRRSAGADRARRLLDAYGRQLAALRLLVRGVSPQAIEPVDVRTLDVATPAGRSLLILGHDDVLLSHVDAGRRLLSRDRHDGGRARARLARAAAVAAGASRAELDPRQDARDAAPSWRCRCC